MRKARQPWHWQVTLRTLLTVCGIKRGTSTSRMRSDRVTMRPIVNRMTDRCLWKHYLPLRSVKTGTHNLQTDPWSTKQERLLFPVIFDARWIINYGVFPHETLFYNVIHDGIYEQESIPVGCVPSAAVAVGDREGGGELPEGCASSRRGCAFRGEGVCFGVCTSGGVVCPGGGVCLGGQCLPRGMCLPRWVCLPGGRCLRRGGVCLPDPPFEQNDSQTGVKTLPFLGQCCTLLYKFIHGKTAKFHMPLPTPIHMEITIPIPIIYWNASVGPVPVQSYYEN